MAYITYKIGDHYDDQKRTEFIIEATDTSAVLPTDVPAGSFAYKEDLSAVYMFGISGTWTDVTSTVTLHKFV